MKSLEAGRIYDWKEQIDFPTAFNYACSEAIKELIDYRRSNIEEGQDKKPGVRNRFEQAKNLLTFFDELSPMVSSLFTRCDNSDVRTVIIPRRHRQGRPYISYGNHCFHDFNYFGLLYFDEAGAPQPLTENLLLELYEQNPKIVNRLGAKSKGQMIDHFIGAIKPHSAPTFK